jgi:hypothetical protein
MTPLMAIGPEAPPLPHCDLCGQRKELPFRVSLVTGVRHYCAGCLRFLARTMIFEGVRRETT